MKMKTPLFAAGCLLALSLTNCSDKPHRPGGPGGGGGGIGMGGPQQNAQKMAADLGLNEDQKKKYTSAMKDHMEKMRKLRGNTSLSEAERTKQTAEARQSLAKKMHGILTPEQFQKWQQERQAMHASQGGAGGPPGGGQGMGGPPAGAPPPPRQAAGPPGDQLPPPVNPGS